MTASIRQLGLRDSFGIDHAISNKLVAPVVQLDLADHANFEFLQSIIQEPSCIYVHFAPPCGTASRARFIKRKGRYNPPVLRTETKPDGLSNLTPLHAAKVASANLLYQRTQALCRLCVAHGALFSIENPARSFMWNTAHRAKFLREIPHYDTFFHHCMYGSSRRKRTRLTHNIPTVQQMESRCDATHAHEPWGCSANGWATAEETAYPWPLCRRLAALVALHLQEQGLHCPTPTFAQHTSQLDAIRQQTEFQPSIKGLPWVSEFKEIRHIHAKDPVPPEGRLISTPSVGHIASASKKTIGIHRSPEEFVATALAAKHPGFASDRLPAPMQEAVEFCASHSEDYVARTRSEVLRAMINSAKELKEQENRLKADMTERRRDVLKNKRLLLFKSLLEQAESPDLSLVDDMTAGFDLTGKLPASNQFSLKYKPACIPPQSLRGIADRAREALLNSAKSSGDPVLDAGVYDATMKEKARGFLRGPIAASAVPHGGTLTRRFGVHQRDKVRPIDDYKASLVNSSVTQVEVVTLHGVDHIAGLGAALLASFTRKGRSEALVGKCWDLAAAYKQIPLSDEAYDLDSYIVVYNPETGCPEIFQQAVLPFGSVASVTAFLRCAVGIWTIGSKLLKLAWTSYFDDFLSLTTTDLAKHTDMCISTFFHLLGWELSAEKLVPYADCCKVLGVELALTKTPTKTFEVRNTPSRVEELTQTILAILDAGFLSKSDAEKLRGRLQFASNQLFGSRFKNCLQELNLHIARNMRTVGIDLERALQLIVHLLGLNPPRTVGIGHTNWFHMYVDASFEPGGFSGIGGILLDPYGQCLGCFSEAVDKTLLDSIMEADQCTAIMELEALAIYVGVKLFSDVVKGARLVVFTDNQSAQASLVKCRSNNKRVDSIIRGICSLEELLSMMCWVERVPSYSNPADVLSREEITEFYGVKRTRCSLMDAWKRCQAETCPGLHPGGERETKL